MHMDTIAAIATAPGAGGIGIIRLSGPDAHSIGKAITTVALTPRHAHFCCFYDATGFVLDTGISLFFPAPNSFTGECVVELQAHGGLAQVQPLRGARDVALACHGGKGAQGLRVHCRQ